MLSLFPHFYTLLYFVVLVKSLNYLSADGCQSNNCSLDGLPCEVKKAALCREFPQLPSAATGAVPPQLISVSVYQNIDENNHTYLNLSFTLPYQTAESVAQTHAVKVRVSSVNDADLKDDHYYTKSQCHLFDFRKASFTQQRTLVYPCFTGLKRDNHNNSVYNITLMALPCAATRVYYVTANVGHMLSTVAIATDVDSSTVWVLAEADHKVKLMMVDRCDTDNKNADIVDTKHASKQSVIFTDLEPGYYYALVTPLKCDAGSCHSVTSYCVQIPQPASTPPTVVATQETTKINKDGVKRIPVDNRNTYNQALKIVLGTIFGVLTAVMMLIAVTCYYKRYRVRQPTLLTSRSSYSSLGETKEGHTILLLYSYDSQEHEHVVKMFADYLTNIFKCVVFLDVYEEGLIKEQSLHMWLHYRLQEATYIIVISSIGARLKCSPKKIQFLNDRPLQDYFSVAIDYVAEEIRAERCKCNSLYRFLVVYTPYTTQSDIPRQLESAHKFRLMDELRNLYLHIWEMEDESNKKIPGVTNFLKNEWGLKLNNAVMIAEEFFRQPNWLDLRLEKTQPARGAVQSKKHQTPRNKGRKHGVSGQVNNHGLPIYPSYSCDIEMKPIICMNSDRHDDKHAKRTYVYGRIDVPSDSPMSYNKYCRKNSLPPSLNGTVHEHNVLDLANSINEKHLRTSKSDECISLADTRSQTLPGDYNNLDDPSFLLGRKRKARCKENKYSLSDSNDSEISCVSRRTSSKKGNGSNVDIRQSQSIPFVHNSNNNSVPCVNPESINLTSFVPVSVSHTILHADVHNDNWQVPQGMYHYKKRALSATSSTCSSTDSEISEHQLQKDIAAILDEVPLSDMQSGSNQWPFMNTFHANEYSRTYTNEYSYPRHESYSLHPDSWC